MNFELLFLVCSYGYLNEFQVHGCQMDYVSGKCNATEFCFCKNGTWIRTTFVAAQSHGSSIKSFSDLCVGCSGSTIISCFNGYNVRQFSLLPESEVEESGETCTFTNETGSDMQVSTTPFVSDSKSTSLPTPERTNEISHSFTTESITNPGDQKCCCSQDFQEKIEFWLNETNQLLHLENLPNSLINIKNELILEKKNLSSSKNLRACAPDQRPSAAVAGYFGAFFISLVFSLIILMDCGKVMTNLRFCKISSN